MKVEFAGRRRRASAGAVGAAVVGALLALGHATRADDTPAVVGMQTRRRLSTCLTTAGIRSTEKRGSRRR